MWILPKQLHTLASVQATEALSLDLNESSQLCAQSLFVRSKPSPLRTWLQKWKRDSWTQHLFGRILRPSLGKAFEIEFTSSLEVIPVSPLVQQANEPAKTTLGICGLGSQPELLSCDPESASSRMSKDTSLLDSEKSLQTWKASVIKRRGEYSARLNAVRRISASASLSWPTAAARDCKGESGSGRQERKGHPADTLPNAVAKHGPADPDNHNPHGNRPESWATPCSRDYHPNGNAIGSKVDLGNQVNGKLNPRWVETLMGLPVAWTMPSCASPVIIEQTNCASLATELCQQQQH